MNILFIDDDQEDIDLYEEAITYLNDSEYLADASEKLTCLACTHCYNIIYVISGLKEKPDFIFLDINMPVVGGKECLLSLKAHPEYFEIPVVMLSTAYRKEDASAFKSAGAFDCIQKPTDFKELVRIFSKFILPKYY